MTSSSRVVFTLESSDLSELFLFFPDFSILGDRLFITNTGHHGSDDGQRLSKEIARRIYAIAAIILSASSGAIGTTQPI